IGGFFMGKFDFHFYLYRINNINNLLGGNMEDQITKEEKVEKVIKGIYQLNDQFDLASQMDEIGGINVTEYIKGGLNHYLKVSDLNDPETLYSVYKKFPDLPDYLTEENKKSLNSKIHFERLKKELCPKEELSSSKRMKI